MKYTIYLRILKFEYTEEQIVRLLKEVGLKVLRLDYITWSSYTCLSIDVQVLNNFEFVESPVEDQMEYIEDKLLFDGMLQIYKVKIKEMRLKV